MRNVVTQTWPVSEAFPLMIRAEVGLTADDDTGVVEAAGDVVLILRELSGDEGADAGGDLSEDLEVLLLLIG